MGEIWGVFYDHLGEKLELYNSTTLYIQQFIHYTLSFVWNMEVSTRKHLRNFIVEQFLAEIQRTVHVEETGNGSQEQPHDLTLTVQQIYLDSFTVSLHSPSGKHVCHQGCAHGLSVAVEKWWNLQCHVILKFIATEAYLYQLITNG